MNGDGTREGNARLLVIDDEAGVRELIMEVACGVGFEVAEADTFDAFRDACGRFDPTLILLDLQMPGTDGVEHLRYLAEQHSRATILLISGYDRRVLESARRLGTTRGLTLGDVLHKPINVADLRQRLARELETPGVRTPREPDIDAALANHEFVLHYQPKVSLASPDKTGTGYGLRAGGEIWPLAGVEALVRWQRPSGELLPPGQFLPLVEKCRKMGPLTLYLARAAFAQMQAWSDGNFKPVVSLNFSAQLLDHLELPDELAELAHAYGVPPDRVIVEITETAAMLDVPACLDITSRLRLKGFALAIDDFGTGYSSLVQLHRMPFSELKIDRAFIAEVGTSEEAQVMVQVMVELAHRLSMTACAEGVEDPPIIDFLRSINCDLAQGYAFGRPVDPETLFGMMTIP